jgi:hypothetical protein
MSAPSTQIVFLITQTGYNNLFKATLAKETEVIFKAILTADGARAYAEASYPDLEEELARKECSPDEMSDILSGIQRICWSFVQDSIKKHLEKHEPDARPAALSAIAVCVMDMAKEQLPSEKLSESVLDLMKWILDFNLVQDQGGKTFFDEQVKPRESRRPGGQRGVPSRSKSTGTSWQPKAKSESGSLQDTEPGTLSPMTYPNPSAETDNRLVSRRLTRKRLA